MELPVRKEGPQEQKSEACVRVARKKAKGQCRDSKVKSCGLLCCDKVESPTKQKAGDAGLGGFQLLAE